MKVSKQGLLEIASHEAIVRSPYFDSVGVLTIGVGHTAMAGNPDPKTLKKSKRYAYRWLLELFKHDIKKYEARVNKAVKVPLSQEQFDALVSFDYNTGGIYKAKLTKYLNLGQYKRAGLAFMGWSKPASIIGRRTKEITLFLSGRYSNNGKILEYQTNGAGKIIWKSAKKVDISEYL